MALAASSSSLPTAGSYPLTLAPGLFDSRKRKADDGELVAMRYTFKPASVASFSDATILNSDTMGGKVLKITTTSHGEQVFDIREEQSKSRECVLVYDEASHTFVLHPLPSVVHLTLNRTPQSHFNRPSASHSESSASSNSVPLAQRKLDEGDDQASHSSGELGRHEVSSMLGEGGDTPRIKRSRPSEPSRPTRGGKGVPRKALPAHAPIPTPSAPAPAKGKGQGRGKANPKKTTKTAAPKKAASKAQAKGAGARAKPPPTPTGKYKSAEIIEDSDEDYDLGDVGGEEEDEFAKMVGESLAEGGDDEDEDEEDDDDDEDDDDELGGARLVVRQQGNSSMADGESEWL